MEYVSELMKCCTKPRTEVAGFEELKRRSHINAAAQAADQGPTSPGGFAPAAESPRPGILTNEPGCFAEMEWLAYCRFVPVAPQTTVRVSMTVAFPRLLPW
jgi:hypothetical protein